MKAGFLFSDRTTAHRVLTARVAHRRPQKPRRRIIATIVAALASLLGR